MAEPTRLEPFHARLDRRVSRYVGSAVFLLIALVEWRENRGAALASLAVAGYFLIAFRRRAAS